MKHDKRVFNGKQGTEMKNVCELPTYVTLGILAFPYLNFLICKSI
jgi:hypothetical protein